jgi:hypothetical protein
MRTHVIEVRFYADTPADADSLFVLICLPMAVSPPVETTASSVQRHLVGSEQLAH